MRGLLRHEMMPMIATPAFDPYQDLEKRSL